MGQWAADTKASTKIVGYLLPNSWRLLRDHRVGSMTYVYVYMLLALKISGDRFRGKWLLPLLGLSTA